MFLLVHSRRHCINLIQISSACHTFTPSAGISIPLSTSSRSRLLCLSVCLRVCVGRICACVYVFWHDITDMTYSVMHVSRHLKATAAISPRHSQHEPQPARAVVQNVIQGFRSHAEVQEHVLAAPGMVAPGATGFTKP